MLTIFLFFISVVIHLKIFSSLWFISLFIISIFWKCSPIFVYPAFAPECLLAAKKSCPRFLIVTADRPSQWPFTIFTTEHYILYVYMVSYLLIRWKYLCLHIIPNYLYLRFQNRSSYYFWPILMLISVLMKSILIFIYHDYCCSCIASIRLIYSNGSSIGHIQARLWSSCNMQ